MCSFFEVATIPIIQFMRFGIHQGNRAYHLSGLYSQRRSCIEPNAFLQHPTVGSETYVFTNVFADEQIVGCNDVCIQGTLMRRGLDPVDSGRPPFDRMDLIYKGD